MEEKPNMIRFFEPPSPDGLLPDAAFPWWWIAAGAFALVVLIVVVCIVWRRSSSEKSSAFRRIAFADAMDSLKEVTSADSRDSAVQCSLILRSYLVKVTGDPALFETHEEFVSRHDSLKDLNESVRTSTMDGFERLSRLKYASEPPAVPANTIVADCRALLETLHQGFTA